MRYKDELLVVYRLKHRKQTVQLSIVEVIVVHLFCDVCNYSIHELGNKCWFLLIAQDIAHFLFPPTINSTILVSIVIRPCLATNISSKYAMIKATSKAIIKSKFY